MRYRAETVEYKGENKMGVRITCNPGWLARLFGMRVRIVYAQPFLDEKNWTVWITTGGRRVSGRMLDAIESIHVHFSIPESV